MSPLHLLRQLPLVPLVPLVPLERWLAITVGGFAVLSCSVPCWNSGPRAMRQPDIRSAPHSIITQFVIVPGSGITNTVTAVLWLIRLSRTIGAIVAL